MIKFLQTAILSTSVSLTGGIFPIMHSQATVSLQQQLIAQVSIVDVIRTLDGNAYILGADEQALGVISSNQHAAESICNQYGSYGSRYSATSVWNQYGQYGSRYSNMSAYNPRANTPPQIVFQEGWFFLSNNPNLPNRIPPSDLFNVLCR